MASFVNAWTAINTFTINTNTGNQIQAGDLLIASLGAGNYTLAGWTNRVANFGTPGMCVLYKLATAADIGASFTFSGGANMTGGIVCLRGINVAGFFDASGAGTTGTSVTPSAGSITLNHSGDVLLWCELSSPDTTPVTLPAGYSTAFNIAGVVGTNQTAAVGYKLGVASGATGAVAGSLGGVSDTWCAVLVGVNNAVDGYRNKDIYRAETNIALASYRSRTLHRLPFRELKRNVPYVTRLIQPPAAKLGWKPSEIFDTTNDLRFNQVAPVGSYPVSYRTRKLARLPFRELRRNVGKLTKDIQPPAAKLGVPPSEIFRATDDLRFNYATANGTPVSYRIRFRARPPFRSLRVFALKKLGQIIQPPASALAVLPRLVFTAKDATRVALYLARRSARYPFRLLKQKPVRELVPPWGVPAAVSSSIPKLIFSAKQTAQLASYRLRMSARAPFKNLRRLNVDRSVLYLGSQVMALLPSQIFRIRDTLQTLSYKSRALVRAPFKELKQFALTKQIRLAQPPAAALGVLPSQALRPRKTKWGLSLPVRRRPALRIQVRKTVILPPAAALGQWMRVVHRPRPVKLSPSLKRIRRFPEHLLKLVQPPASALALLPSQIFEAKNDLRVALYRLNRLRSLPFRSLRRFGLKLIKTLQPSAAKLGVLPRIVMDVQKHIPWRAKQIKYPKGRNLLHRTRDLLGSLGVGMVSMILGDSSTASDSESDALVALLSSSDLPTEVEVVSGVFSISSVMTDASASSDSSASTSLALVLTDDIDALVDSIVEAINLAATESDPVTATDQIVQTAVFIIKTLSALDTQTSLDNASSFISLLNIQLDLDTLIDSTFQDPFSTTLTPPYVFNQPLLSKTIVGVKLNSLVQYTNPLLRTVSFDTLPHQI